MSGIIINTVPFKEKSLEETMPILYDNGWHDLELHMNHFLKYDPDLEHLGRAREIIRKNNLNIIAMAGGWCDFVGDDTAMANTDKSIERQVTVLNALNCEILRLFLGKIDEAQFTPEIKQNLIKRLLVLSSRYPDVTFVFETHDGISLDAKVMSSLFSTVNRANIRVNFDAANIEKAGKDSFVSLKELFPWIGHMHIKGLKSRSGSNIKDFYCAYGDGIFSYEKIFRYLKDNDYKGYLSVEFEGEGDPVTEINNSLKSLETDLNQMTK